MVSLRSDHTQLMQKHCSEVLELYGPAPQILASDFGRRLKTIKIGRSKTEGFKSGEQERSAGSVDPDPVTRNIG